MAESKARELGTGSGFGVRAALLLLALLAALDLWAMASIDPDFYLPDPFRPFALGLIGVFVASALLPWKRPSRAIRVGAALVCVAVLCLEAKSRFRTDGEARYVEQTRDVLLRYRYRPGAEVTRDAKGRTVTINHLGLMDAEHVVPKPADVFRVVVLSGSIANDGAIPYDDRFWRKLEGELTDVAGPGRRVDVVNVSVHGYSEVQQVRLLEQVGLQYEPDVVVAAYMLSAAGIQNGGYRRFGNSFFLFRFLPVLKSATTGSVCSLFAPFHERYSFDLVVRNSFERLELLRRIHGFRALVAVLPVVEEFDDPVCSGIYDHVVATARESGLPAIRVADAFLGEPATRFAKPDGRWDVCHPNPDGHARIAAAIAAGIRALPPAAEGPR